MRSTPQLLVIGPAALSSAVATCLPRCKSVATEDLLGGLWTFGQRTFDGVVLSYALGHRVISVIRNLRDLRPDTRIIVTVSPAEEPNVRQALDAGADEYILEPVAADDLESALAVTTVPSFDESGAAVPSVEEVVQLSDVLKNLSEGSQATLDRLVTLVQNAFDTQGAAIRIDELAATCGQLGRAVLQEPIRRGDTVVGNIALGQRRRGSYSASDAARLRDYARLIDSVIAQTREREHWQDLAWRDDLSGLRNRRYFDATLERLISKAAAERHRVTVFLFDIDDFKSYNDHYGHETGDALIREVAQLLTHCSREHDIVARYGGDEFAVIMWDAERPRVPGSEHPSEPSALADRFCAVIRSHNFTCLGPGAPGPVTISGGLACYPWDGQTRPEIIRAADAALLTAKRAGKNKIALANGVTEPGSE